MARGQVRPLSVAPMMERTDRHFRYMARQLSRQVLLTTEMVTTGALLRGAHPERHLRHHPSEHPVAIQLGGDDPADLAECARMAESAGFDEVNLNVGCPSDRVQSGCFGVVLMARPERVAECVEAMRTACALPVTVKHRIGFDESDSYEHMLRFVDVVAAAGADRFTVHARKAWLSGLSPKENREVPPLRPELVARLKADRPSLVVELNGGVGSLDAVRASLALGVDAVMVGRAAWDDPWGVLGRADSTLWGTADPCGRPEDLLPALGAWLEGHLAEGGRAAHALKPWHNLFAGVPGARAWRRVLSEGASRVPDGQVEGGRSLLDRAERALRGRAGA